MTRVFFSVQVCWRGSGWLSLVGKAAGLRDLVLDCLVVDWLVCSYRCGLRLRDLILGCRVAD